MSEPSNLLHAPIAEAVLDIRVQPPQDIQLGALAAFYPDIAADFPIRNERTSTSVNLTTKVGSLPTIAQSTTVPDGYFMKSEDQTRMVQIAFDGFDYHRLRPYSNWETFSSEAKSLWERYEAAVHPERISRVALRYINRIEIPLPIKDLKDYLLTGPEIAPALSQSMTHFFMRIHTPYEAQQAQAIITLAVDANAPDDDTVPLIFDIDVFREAEPESTLSEIWTIFDTLRGLKNHIFFKSITKSAEELFK